jgi:hypothetical protein
MGDWMDVDGRNLIFPLPRLGETNDGKSCGAI